ncbi:hypothetical protein NA57DRAFT_73104 [Rhizodiscina lignyota]|uniref:CFEM domain-containing protein n=1 Tax=Rhizodiscina lignyota TaxID=1504668 RepID=A0A9P4MDI0_9PEZI|nr:hypothetical protein NA57DRAFT_73104 [Rhizodiscina lignyota]
MKFALVALAASVALASAAPVVDEATVDILDQFPTCAVEELKDIAKEKCGDLLNIACICSNPAVRETATHDVVQACGLVQSLRALKTAKKVCGENLKDI